jgi:hypothetical protein
MNYKYEGLVRLGAVMAAGLIAGLLVSAVYGDGLVRQIITAASVSVAFGIAMLVKLALEAAERRRERRRNIYRARHIEPTSSRIDAA